MINLAAFKTPVFQIFSMLVSLIMLQGCGGQRDEPFDPGSLPCSSSSTSSSIIGASSTSSSSMSSATSSCGSSSSKSSSIASSSSKSSTISSSSVSSTTLDITLIGSGTQTHTAIDTTERNVQVMKNDTDFNNFSDAYANENIADQDFDNGQVILIDDGAIDGCGAHLEFLSKLSTENVGANSLKIILEYVEKPTLNPCTPSVSRPFYFYYIKSTKLLVFEDKIVQ
ncbi:MAG: hypothetical protein V4732_00450 [Pseudomonadota bacterium]